jgi:alkylhydroperoxidase family enzyme
MTLFSCGQAPSLLISGYFRVLAHKPDVLRAFRQLHGAIMADGALSAKLKDLAYLRVSILDGCGF